MNIQNIIKSRRLELGLTLKDVANALGVSEGTVSRYESKDIQNMGIDKIEPLAKVLRCSPGYLMGWEDEEKVADSLFSLTASPKVQQLVDVVSDMKPELIDKVIDYAEYVKTKEEGN